MRGLQRAIPAFRGFASTPARFASSSAATHLPADIMGKKRNEATAAGNGTEEGESLPPLSMKDFQVYNRLSVQMDQFVRTLYPTSPQVPNMQITRPSTTTFVSSGTTSKTPAPPPANKDTPANSSSPASPSAPNSTSTTPSKNSTSSPSSRRKCPSSAKNWTSCNSIRRYMPALRSWRSIWRIVGWGMRSLIGRR